MAEIRKIYRIVLLLTDGTQGNWQYLTEKTYTPETGKYPQYLLRNIPGTMLIDLDSWRFLDIQGDTLGDIYVICPRMRNAERILFLKQKESGGLNFTYMDIESSEKMPFFSWIPLPSPKSLRFSEQVEEKIYIVFNHAEYVCSEFYMGQYGFSPKLLDEKLVTGYDKKSRQYLHPGIFSLSDSDTILCTAGKTDRCKQFFGRSCPLKIDGFLKFLGETQTNKAPRSRNAPDY